MRRTRTLLAVLVVGAGVACGNGSATDLNAVAEGESSSSAFRPAAATTVPSPPEASAPGPDVSLWLSADRVPPGPVDVAGVLINNTGVDVTFGVAAEVERWDGDEWVPHGWFGMCVDHWHCTAELQPAADGIAVRSIGFAPTLGSPGPVERFSTSDLRPGWYRISQAADGKVAAGVIQIDEDAELPAPLVPVDDPAISIRPAVVPTGGATVTLHPRVPARSGEQSMDDVEAAIAGLAETVDVDRWDGGRWVRTTEVPLERGVPGESTAARSAIVPSLDAGAYRFVRTGPGEPHIDNFWIKS